MLILTFEGKRKKSRGLAGGLAEVGNLGTLLRDP